MLFQNVEHDDIYAMNLYLNQIKIWYWFNIFTAKKYEYVFNNIRHSNNTNKAKSNWRLQFQVRSTIHFKKRNNLMLQYFSSTFNYFYKNCDLQSKQQKLFIFIIYKVQSYRIWFSSLNVIQNIKGSSVICNVEKHSQNEARRKKSTKYESFIVSETHIA